MRVFDLRTEDGRLRGCEIENLRLGRRGVGRVVRSIPGVRVIGASASSLADFCEFDLRRCDSSEIGLTSAAFPRPVHTDVGSWLNLIERWFAELTNKPLRRGAHRGVAQLEAAIRDSIDAHHAKLKPFVWTKTVDQILEKHRAVRPADTRRSGRAT